MTLDEMKQKIIPDTLQNSFAEQRAVLKWFKDILNVKLWQAEM